MESIEQDQNAKVASTPAKTIKPSRSWTNPRKRPHHADPATVFEPTDDDALPRNDDTEALHVSKRSRAAEWPLTNTNDVSNTFSQEEETNGPNEKRSSAASVRPSKFQEGSMNDKVSQRPPRPYIKDDQAMENYVKSQITNHNDMDLTYDAGIEPTKPSGMFRFGKAIVSTLNPTHLWQGINGIWKEKEKETKTVPRKDVMQERQAKAIEAYAELKKSGYKGTQMAPTQAATGDVPAIHCEDAENASRNPFRDSGIDVDEYRSFSDHKSIAQTLNFNETLKVPPSKTNVRSASPFSNASSGRKSSLHFSKPSFQNLKKVKSQIYLPSAKKPTEAPFSPSIETDNATTPALLGNGLRRQASKKDISRQSKLSKRVSNLENKLQIARQELEMSMISAPPVPEMPGTLGRKPFVPGGLFSLPSERNMTPQQIAESGGPALTESAQTTNRGRTTSARLVDQSQPTPSMRKRDGSKVNNENARHVCSKKEEDLDSESMKDSAPQKRARREAKPQDFKKTSSHSPVGIKKRQLPWIESKTPQNSPVHINEKAPPVPATIPTFNPATVDHAKLLSMRSIASKALFGALAEDLSNLRKEFPTASEHDLIEYLKSLGWQPKTTKTTDILSVAHEDRPQSPFLGRSSISPMRTRSKNAKRCISPPPPSLWSAKKIRFEPYARDAPARSDSLPVKGVKRTHGREVEGKGYRMDKPLPKIQKEEYEWDEDVF